jgi:hypothetical protein
MPFFGFQVIYDGQQRRTKYSYENQAKLTTHFNGHANVVEIWHETQHGEFKGVILPHIVNFDDRTVTNKNNGEIYSLVLM